MAMDPAAFNRQNARVLEQFGVHARDLIGEGGESRVYALGDDTILRLPRSRTFESGSRVRLADFLEQIGGRLPYATPEILDIGPRDTYTIERRLPGRVMTDVLRIASSDARDHAFRNYVTAAEALGQVEMPHLPFGHALDPAPVRADSWHTFARESLAQFRARNRITIAKEIGDPYVLFDKAADMILHLPETPPHALVHGDFLPGNVLMDNRLQVTGVIDFGMYTAIGDPLLDLAVSYLSLELLPETSAHDARFVRDILLERHGDEIADAFRFYRAYLAFSMADPANAAEPYPRLYGWSMAMLRLLAADRLPV